MQKKQTGMFEHTTLVRISRSSAIGWVITRNNIGNNFDRSVGEPYYIGPPDYKIANFPVMKYFSSLIWVEVTAIFLIEITCLNIACAIGLSVADIVLRASCVAISDS